MAGDVDSRRFAAEKLEEQRGGMLYAERRMLAEGRLEDLAETLERRSRRAMTVLVVLAAVGVAYLGVGLAVLKRDVPDLPVVNILLWACWIVGNTVWVVRMQTRNATTMTLLLEMLRSGKPGADGGVSAAT